MAAEERRDGRKAITRAQERPAKLAVGMPLNDHLMKLCLSVSVTRVS